MASAQEESEQVSSWDYWTAGCPEQDTGTLTTRRRQQHQGNVWMHFEGRTGQARQSLARAGWQSSNSLFVSGWKPLVPDFKSFTPTSRAAAHAWRCSAQCAVVTFHKKSCSASKQDTQLGQYRCKYMQLPGHAWFCRYTHVTFQLFKMLPNDNNTRLDASF